MRCCLGSTSAVDAEATDSWKRSRFSQEKARTAESYLRLLTSAQQQEISAAFRKFDRDGNGSIDMSELREMMRTLGMVATEAQVTELFQKMDTNLNGRFEFEEFAVAAARRLLLLEGEEEMQEAFRVFDTNGDGILQSSEVRNLLTEVGDTCVPLRCALPPCCSSCKHTAFPSSMHYM